MSTIRTHSTDDSAKVEYWKSILKIDTVVAVTLAHQKIPIDRILREDVTGDNPIAPEAQCFEASTIINQVTAVVVIELLNSCRTDSRFAATSPEK